MKTPQSNVPAAKDKRPPSALAAHLAADEATRLDTDAYLNADNGWPVSGHEAAELQKEYDALADLFLNEEPVAIRAGAVAVPAAPAVAVSPSITGRATPVATRQLPSQGVDCLMLGHLPVLASAWTSQLDRKSTRLNSSHSSVSRMPSSA